METNEQRKARLTRNTRAYRLRHPDRVKVSRKVVYNNRKTRAMELLGGAYCSQCGCDEFSFLEINHIDGGGCKEWKTRRASIHDDLLSGKRMKDGLNVLCRVCNAIEFLNRKNPHASGQFIARWEKFSGKDAVLLRADQEGLQACAQATHQ